MRFIAVFAAVAALSLVVPGTADAQPGPPPGPGPGAAGPPPGPGPGQGMHRRALWHPRGLTFGFDFGIGGMSSENTGSIECFNCDFQPVSGGFGGFIGFQIGPRLSITANLRGTGQSLDADGFAILVQTQLTANLRYWVAPRFWVEGGLGFSALSISIDDGGPDDQLDEGGAVTLAAGFEIARGRRLAIDLQGRYAAGTYAGLGDQIHSFIVGIGFSWYTPLIIYVR